MLCEADDETGITLIHVLGDSAVALLGDWMLSMI